MVGSITCEVQIEDARNHPAETVQALRDILSSGATIIPDPKRRGFYEVPSGSLVYYIHVLPASGNILLLATWPNDAEASRTNQAA